MLFPTLPLIYRKLIFRDESNSIYDKKNLGSYRSEDIMKNFVAKKKNLGSNENLGKNLF